VSTRNVVIGSRVLATCAMLALALSSGSAQQPPGPRQERVILANGASAATVKGTLKDGADMDYAVRAAAGQTLHVQITASNAQNEFNVLPPGSKAAAMFSSASSGARTWSGRLPSDGDYVIRVYLMRPAARRHESSSFTLTVALRGEPLPPLTAARDAKVAGTSYHATAKLPCALPYQPAVQWCDAGVVRRGRDGTATVEVIGPAGVQRRVLFVQGKPAASDAMEPLAASRKGDVTTVEVAGERYDVPDAFLNGG
jgi:hypothetical protein